MLEGLTLVAKPIVVIRFTFDYPLLFLSTKKQQGEIARYYFDISLVEVVGVRSSPATYKIIFTVNRRLG